VRLVLDWDGTCTEVDGLHMLLEEFGDREVFERMEGVLGAGLTLHEVIAAEIATITVPLDEAVAWVRANVTLRAGFHELAERYDPVILSSGFHELIGPVLVREGVALDVRANLLDARADGWRPIWRDEAVCAVCGEACKRAALADEGPYVFVGDGYSDRCAALGAERVFARDTLADYLEAEGHPFEGFVDLRDVLRADDIRLARR
jgi:2-hydroxy-3-keto-5-methylthiopentenyl-1-phosphate phosphatase